MGGEGSGLRGLGANLTATVLLLLPLALSLLTSGESSNDCGYFSVFISFFMPFSLTLFAVHPLPGHAQPAASSR